MALFLSIGEAMVELSGAAPGGSENAALWRLGFAGDTLNTAWYVRASLGAEWQVSYLTRLGQDPFSTRMLDFLHRNAIDTRFTRRDAERTVGLYAIELDRGERSFVYWRSQSAARLLASDEALLDEAFAAADAVFLSGVTLAILPDSGREALLSRLMAARQAGKMTAFDPNLRPKLWESPDAMRHWLMRAAAAAAILLPGYEDEAEWFGDTSPEACADRWAQAGAAEIVVKNGGGPILVQDASGRALVPVARQQPVDSTGAGDSFNGGYLGARLRGLSPAEAVPPGHALALRVIAAPGALIRL